MKPLMCCTYQYITKQNVLRCLQKVSLPTARSLRLSGSEFHTNRPATEKAHWANVLCLSHGTTSSHRLADRTCHSDVTLAEVEQVLACTCKQLYIMTPSLYVTRSGIPSQCHAQHGVKKPPQASVEPRCDDNHPSHSVQLILVATCLLLLSAHTPGECYSNLRR